MKPITGFLSALAFMTLVVLAFNPYLVLALQEKLRLAPALIPGPLPEIEPRDRPVLPNTDIPDAENLPRIPNFDRIAIHDVWVGDTPCGPEIFKAPDHLPGLGLRQDGPLLTTAIAAGNRRNIIGQPTYLYKSDGGVTLKLVEPIIQYYDVSGRRFRDVRNDIFERQPLEAIRQSGEDGETSSPDIPNTQRTGRVRITTVADILSPSTLSYTLSGSRQRYRLLVNQTVLTSAFLITLPRWKNYDMASSSDKQKWDDFLCNAAHHELGHLRIRLDILAETLDGYAALPPASSHEEMETLVREYRTDISDRVQERQDAYHIYNGGGLRRGMTELPYAELPFPWLEKPETKTAEQSPAQQ